MRDNLQISWFRLLKKKWQYDGKQNKKVTDCPRLVLIVLDQQQWDKLKSLLEKQKLKLKPTESEFTFS